MSKTSLSLYLRKLVTSLCIYLRRIMCVVCFCGNTNDQTKSSTMPLDMWREILVRLPGESLLRSRAVCTDWRALIDDPCFVRAHTKNQQPPSSNVIVTTNSTSPPICYSLDFEALISNGQQPQTKIAAVGPLSQCNGLVLARKPALTIWNPLTHERLELPPPPHPKDGPSAFGLGYDAATDDYKAVVIQSSRHATHVYSLKSDTWRRTTNFPPRGGPADGSPGIFVCGALHWLRVGLHDVYDDKIIAMDVGTEKYSVLQMPGSTTYKFSPDLLLSVMGGCLAVCHSGKNTHLDVWVMRVYGDEGSWSKSFSIEMKPGVCKWIGYLRPVAFVVKNEEEEEEEEESCLVFLQDSKKMFFVFDVETKSLKRVGMGKGILRGDSDSDSDSDSFWCAQQMFAGTIFRLHANCGGGGGARMSSS